MSHSAHFHVENPSFENWLLRVVMVTVVWLPLNVCSSGVGSSGAAAACVSASPSPSAAIPVRWQYPPPGPPVLPPAAVAHKTWGVDGAW